MDITNLNNKLVAVLGFGQEGRATTRYLLKHGIKPVLFDQRPWEEWEKSTQDEIKALGVNFIFGPHAFLELKGFDVVFKSPGIKKSHLTINDLQLTSQTKFFFDNCPSKIIGVTGTKGKGTTASLIYEILRTTHYPLPTTVYLTGNIGKVQPLEIIDNLNPHDWVVYELSSFQLQDLGKSPHIGVVLMVTSEHLDYHKDLNEYIEAKTAIVKYQGNDDFAVINKDFPASLQIGSQGKGEKRIFSTQETSVDCYVNNNFLYCYLKGEPEDAPLLNINDLQLRGKHNLQNVCAAVLAGSLAGAKKEAVIKAVLGFKGLEHRLEFVEEKDDIKFYNDSFSTTPETAIAAINSFSEPLILILGGSSKNSDFTELGKTIIAAKNIKALILVGEEASRIKSVIKQKDGHPALLEGAKNMEEIFSQIKSVSAIGDVVLLSPACASFGMFKNYKDRGEQFKELASSLY